MEWIRPASNQRSTDKHSSQWLHPRRHPVVHHKHWTEQYQRDHSPWEPSSHGLACKSSTLSQACLDQQRMEATSCLKAHIYLGFVMPIFRKTWRCSQFSLVLSLDFRLKPISTNMPKFLMGKEIHETHDRKNPWLLQPVSPILGQGQGPVGCTQGNWEGAVHHG